MEGAPARSSPLAAEPRIAYEARDKISVAALRHSARELTRDLEAIGRFVGACRVKRDEGVGLASSGKSGAAVEDRRSGAERGSNRDLRRLGLWHPGADISVGPAESLGSPAIPCNRLKLECRFGPIRIHPVCTQPSSECRDAPRP
jgi:hypothetical protein